MIIVTPFRKAPFSKCFLSTQKRKAGVVKSLPFEERFRKAPFSWRIGVDDRPNRRNKAAFLKATWEVYQTWRNKECELRGKLDSRLKQY